MDPRGNDTLHAWLVALEARHLADRTFPEVRRALQALSTRYVERRNARGGIDRATPFSSAGKRAAYALFYGPLHLLTVGRIVEALGAGDPPPREIVDLGTGSGAGGAAWALACRGRRPRIRGVDASAWAVAETNRAWRDLGLAGRSRRGAIEDTRLPGARSAILLAWTVNELDACSRGTLLSRLAVAADRGARILVVEPIARAVAPWWGEWGLALGSAGARDDRWRFAVDLPEPVRTLDRAAGLDHRELTARSLYVPGRSR